MLILETLSYLVNYRNNVGCDGRLQTVDIGWLRLIDGRSFSLLRTILKVILFSYSWGYCYQEFVPLSLFATCENENVFCSWG